MAEKQTTLEDLARAEAASEATRELKKKAYRDGQRKLQTLTPERFFTLARQLKEGVARYNGAARLSEPLRYTESAAVTAHDDKTGSDYVAEVRRDPNWLVLVLRSLWRMQADDAYIIEVEGLLGKPPEAERVMLRIQGVWHDEELRWRVTANGREVDTDIDELPERVVAACATGEFSRLWTRAPFLQIAY